MSDEPLLAIRDLDIEIADKRSATPILRGVDLKVRRSSVHGLVGESGAGKTMVAKAIVGVLPDRARITRGAIAFDGVDLVGLAERERRRLLGRSITMILQNPMTALNPVVRIADQTSRILRHHLGLAGKAARVKAIDMLAAVHIRQPERVMQLYPFELSGGMCQRVVIALAFACEPRLIVADEPTSALDVTVQYHVLRLIHEMQARTGAAVLFVTHDLGVVAKICDEVTVMFGGRVLESGPTAGVFAAPRHEYTAALLAATPRHDRPDAALNPIASTLRERLWRETAAYDRSASHL
jgi:peptide/nickel transport system ATP-binding protein